MMSPEQGRSHNRSDQRPSNDEREVLEALTRLNSFALTKVEAFTMERALIEAVLGRIKTFQKIGQEEKMYLLYTDYGNSDETVVFVYDPQERSRHKYIIASAHDPRGKNHSVIVCAPMDWTPLHQDLLLRVLAATGAQYACSGGGYVDISKESQLDVNGESGTFGEGDHMRALAAFKRAVQNSAQSNDAQSL